MLSDFRSLSQHLNTRSYWGVLSSNCRIESKSSSKQRDHRKKKQSVMARTNRIANIPSTDGSATRMPILAAAREIEEMAEGVELESDCE